MAAVVSRGREGRSARRRHRARPAGASTGWQRHERWVGVLMTLPQFIPFLLFAILPLVYVVYISFTTYDGFTQPLWVGLQNYRNLLEDTAWWHSVWVTFVMAVAKIIIEIPLALLLAVLLSRKRPGGSVFRTIYFIPHVVSIAVMGIVFYFLLRPVDGIINGLLHGAHILNTPVDWLGHTTTAIGSIVAVGVWAGFGINTVLFLVGIQTIPPELQESAATDGATSWQRFRHVTLPLLTPILRIVTVLTIVYSLRSFDLIKTLTDGGPGGTTEVMFTYLFGYYFGSQHNAQFGYASALSVVASIIIAIVSLLYLYLSRRSGGLAEPRKGSR